MLSVRRRVTFGLSVLLVLAVVAFAAAINTSRTSEGRLPDSGDAEPNPSNPMPGGVLLRSASSSSLPFSPVVPGALGTPSVIQMTPPTLVPLSNREIMLGYTSSQYGPFV